MKSNSYSFDALTNTVTISKDFARKASQLNTPEYKTLLQLRNDNPSLKIVMRESGKAQNGSGITFASRCHVDELALNWQRLIETHVFEKPHKGVLTGARLTDVQVELLHGRAHLKHTEGGDFRQSTYRAIRNALMYGGCVLLEPICRFDLRLSADDYGRVMGDLTRMRAKLDPPALEGDSCTLRGECAFAEFSGYIADFMAATHGRGVLRYRLDHYAPCRDPQPIIEAARYNPLADDTPDSVFCSHGAGYTVPWDEVRNHAHTQAEW